MFSQIRTHLFSILFLITLTAGFYYPLVFQNKTLKQSDIDQGIGINEESRKLKTEKGEIALWYGRVFSGMPSFILGYPFSDDIKNEIYAKLTFFLEEPARIHFVMLVSAYVLGFVLTQNPFLALLLAISYTFTSFNILSLEAGHNSKIRAMAFLPLILSGYYLIVRKKWITGLTLTALGVAFHINCGHYQISYYFFLAIGLFSLLYGAFHFYQHRNILDVVKPISLFGLAVVLGIGANFGKLATSMEYQKQSIRGKYELTPKDNGNRDNSEGLDKEYAFSWSQGITESITFLVPGAFGGSSNEEISKKSALGKVLRSQNIPLQPMPLYFGDQPFTGGPIYAGAIICLLFVLSYFVFTNQEKILVSSVFLAFMVIAWGKNLEFINYFLFDTFPYFNKFRAVSMALYVPLAVMAIVAVVLLKRIFESENKAQFIKPVLISSGITGGICFLLFLFPSIILSEGASDSQLPEWIIEPLTKDRASLVSGDALRSLLFIASAVTLLYFYMKGKLNFNLLVISISLLTLIDLWSFNYRYLTPNDYISKKKNTDHILPTEADLSILKDKELGYRVYNIQNPFNDGRTSYFHRSVGGYHPAKMRRYQDVIERHLSENNRNVIRMLNVKYIVKGTTARDVIPMADQIGAAWLVDSIKTVNSPDEESESLKDFDPEKTAIIDVQKFPIISKTWSKATEGDYVKLTSYSPNRLEYESNAGSERLAVFSEVYYQPGWKAFINGIETPHFRANYILRAMFLPAGKNKIEFVFEPSTYTMGKKINTFFNSLIGLLILVTIGYNWYASKKAKG